MRVPFSYIRRNLWVRKLTTAPTAGGMALVVFVFAARHWTVVGIFDGGRTAFDSEIWGDVEQIGA